MWVEHITIHQNSLALSDVNTQFGFTFVESSNSVHILRPVNVVDNRVFLGKIIQIVKRIQDVSTPFKNQLIVINGICETFVIACLG